jgi:hypothetical protein
MKKEEISISRDELEEGLRDELEEALSDIISEKTGFCHLGFTYTITVQAVLDTEGVRDVD